MSDIETSGGTEKDGITIVGAGMGSTIFEQNGTGDQFMRISGSASDITISDLTIQNYDEASHGAGFDITTSGTVTLQDVEIKKCSTAASGDNGAGVYVSSSSTVTLDRCKLHQITVQTTAMPKVLHFIRKVT